MNSDAGTVTSGDITIDSNHETVEQIQAVLFDEPDASATTDAVDEPAETAAPAVVQDALPLEDADEVESKPKRNRRADPAEAVKSAVAKQREAERRAEAAEAQIQALTQPVETPPAPVGNDWARFKQIPGVPTVDQFESYDDYSMAMASFVADVRHQERDVAQASAYQQHVQEQSQQEQRQQWFGRLDTARQQDPDFDSSLNPDTPMSLPMQHLAMNSPVGVQMLQYLSSHPEDAQRISTLHPAETYREMGKIEARLEAAPSTRASARAVSNAKPPIRPLGTSPHVPDAFAVSDDLSFDEHFRRMNASDRARGRL